MYLTTIDTAELVDLRHTSFARVGLQLNYGRTRDVCIHSCQFIFTNLSCKLHRITAEYTFRVCHINHIIR
jgi:hypothetical protein